VSEGAFSTAYEETAAMHAQCLCLHILGSTVYPMLFLEQL